MREIRFRGKRPDGSWAYGDLTHKTDGCYIEREMCAWWVDKDTVGQFTGLKDKNGVDIYEGDVISNDKHIQIVIFGKFNSSDSCLDDYIGFYSVHPNHLSCPHSVEYDIRNGYFVIDNIHDNPQMIK